jgi:chemotaxis protein CheZ
MPSADDDLDALFEAEASQYNKGTSQKQPSVAPVVAATPPMQSVPAATPAKPTASADSADKMEKYYLAVSGMNNTGSSANTAQVALGDGEGSLYERLGGIVRLLHNSLRELGYDKSLSDASTQITDANDRLAYIATLTEQSAVKVLNTLDAGMPAQEMLVKHAKEMEQRWGLLFEGKIGVDEFKVLAADSRKFAEQVASEGEKEKARLLEIMMAQDFQDLTGQIIKKVVGITQSIENDLAKLLLDNAPAAVKGKHVELLNGPSVPSAAMVQNDVDDLLADLGF